MTTENTTMTDDLTPDTGDTYDPADATNPLAPVAVDHRAVRAAWVARAEAQAAQGQQPTMPCINSAAVFAAVSLLGVGAPGSNDCARWNALRVGPLWQTTWDDAPVVPAATPGSKQIEPGRTGLRWPIYSRDVQLARSSTAFLVALATDAPLPTIREPRHESGLWHAFQAALASPEAIADGTARPSLATVECSLQEGELQAWAYVWVRRVQTELGPDGEPVTYPARAIAISEAVTLRELVADPVQHIYIPPDAMELEGLRECIVNRLTKLRMRGRPAGSTSAPKQPRQPKAQKPMLVEAHTTQPAAQAVDSADLGALLDQCAGEVARLQATMGQMAESYAAQLAALGAPDAPGSVPVLAAAGYLVDLIKLLPPDAPQDAFQVLAGRISTDHPALYQAIATRLQEV